MSPWPLFPPSLQHSWSRGAAQGAPKPPGQEESCKKCPWQHGPPGKGHNLTHTFLFFSCGVTPPFPLLFTAALVQLWGGKNLSSQGKPGLCCTPHLASTQLSATSYTLHSGLKRFKFCTLNSLMINIMEFIAIMLSFMEITKSRICSKQNIQNECLAGTDLVQ